MASTRYADVWYNVIRNIVTSGKFALILPFLTIGLSSTNNQISSFFSNIYDSIIPLETNFFISILVICLAILINDYLIYWTHRIS